MHNTAAMMSSASGEWETPDDFFAAVNAEFKFVLDVCATEANTKCAEYITPEQNALAQEWHGPAWMNPPYGRAVGTWLGKAHDEAHARGCVVVCLLPARTDTKWWWEWVLKANEVRFLKGRLKFVGAPSGATFPSCLAIFDGNAGRSASPRVVWWDWRSGGRTSHDGVALDTQPGAGDE